MNLSRILAPLLLALAGLAQAQISPIGYVQMDLPDTYDATMIATALGPATPLRVTLPGLPVTTFFTVQPVRVVDSRVFPPGALVDVYLPYRRPDDGTLDLDWNPRTAIDQAGALPIGKPVLVVAGRSPKPGLLHAPYAREGAAASDYGLPEGVRTPYVAGYAVFETTQGRLAPKANPMGRMLESVAAAIPRTSDSNVARIGEFVSRVRLPEWKGAHGDPRTDDAFSRAFADAVARERPYRRALIHYALNYLYYIGYGDRYLQDVYASATDPDAFPDEVQDPFYREDPVNDGRVPKGFKHDPAPTLAEYAALLRTARSPMVAAWLLADLPKIPDADVRALARFLDSPDARLRWAFVERLAKWYGEAAPEMPRHEWETSGAERLVWPGLDAAVARWKARLGKG